MSRAQIFPQPNPHAFCQVHSCRNVAKHFIGKPGSGSLLRLTYMVCDDCLRDIVSTIPEEFLPKIDPIERLEEIKALIEAGVLTKDDFLNAFMPLITQWIADEEAIQLPAQPPVEETPPPPVIDPNVPLDEPESVANDVPPVPQPSVEPQEKKYTCKYCGEPAESPQKLAAHVRRCPMNPKNQGGDNLENDGKQEEG